MAGRKILHRHKELTGELLQRHANEGSIEEPVVVGVRVVLRPLERIAAQIEEQRHAQFGERFPPYAECFATVLEEDDFPVLDSG